jgi:predicted DNA-binding protein
MRVLGLRVTVDQDEFLNRVARKRGVPKSVYLRLLIEKHMENSAAPYNPITA